jgi:antitoxin YobK
VGLEELRRGLDIARSDDSSDFGSPAPDDLIKAVENHLGVRLPPSYREFVSSVGWCSVGGREFYGITRSGLEAQAVPSVVFATRDERQNGLPLNLLLIEYANEVQHVLETHEGAPSREGAVMVWTPASDPTKLEVVADDFGSYFLRAVEEATE